MPDVQVLVGLAYLLATLTFVLGLKAMSSPRNAVFGNRLAAAGMVIAVVATFFVPQVRETAAFPLILGGIAAGTAVGVWSARSVQMTAMPQMIAVFNGAGGGAAALVASLEFARELTAGHAIGLVLVLSSLFGLIVGSYAFSGSVVAFGKLQGLITPKAFRYTGQQIVTGIFALGILGLAVTITLSALLGAPAPLGVLALFAILGLLALVFGVAMVMPIGGADMPVVISLLNASTGMAVAATGFALQNPLLIVSGTLVGAAGSILTQLMSKAMNRSLGNVLFGAFGAAAAAGGPARADDGRTFREISAEDAAILLGYAQSVIVVPGYGMAVAQAQHNVRELADLLEAKGVDVKYAIHPVAGRMPGHMNVLLAEANVPYEKLFDMDQVNDDFQRTDVALVVGANDVTNPAARSDRSSPIYGMPILNVDQAQNVIVIKRSMKPGFAGIDNDLYLDPKTGMLFGDAKEAVQRVVSQIKSEA
ncbi:MAG TPA: NAD(P)(+) transhydrogenase (Re/Si-specific) subunit beta [Candidatus Limnocylindrales bacterium]|nr:NAD(P)(+) transhydrogenase (Re/Si-specific) subunit beta [Candidatus Limnocylindrales bacterium]